MKLTIHISLLALWLCALTLPSLVTIYNHGETPVFVMNMAEEEQEEQGSKDISEEKIISSNSICAIFLFSNKKKSDIDNYILGRSTHSLDITLPPPEHKA